MAAKDNQMNYSQALVGFIDEELKKLGDDDQVQEVVTPTEDGGNQGNVDKAVTPGADTALVSDNEDAMETEDNVPNVDG